MFINICPPEITEKPRPFFHVLWDYSAPSPHFPLQHGRVVFFCSHLQFIKFAFSIKTTSSELISIMFTSTFFSSVFFPNSNRSIHSISSSTWFRAREVTFYPLFTFSSHQSLYGFWRIKVSQPYPLCFCSSSSPAPPPSSSLPSFRLSQQLSSFRTSFRRVFRIRSAHISSITHVVSDDASRRLL